MTIETAVTLFVPVVALVISIWSLLLGSKYRSLESAQKYIDILEKAESLNSDSKFDMQLRSELEQTAHYYLWKSMSRFSSQRRSSYNYIGFLIFTSIGLGLSFFSALQSYINEGLIPILPILGTLILLLSIGLIAYSRYESLMLESFIDLRKYGLYVDSYSYSFLSKEKVLNGGIVPVLVSFVLSIAVLSFCETNIALGVFGVVIAIIAIGNNIEMIKNDKWAKDELERLQKNDKARQ
jgi:hypothetical protein